MRDPKYNSDVYKNSLRQISNIYIYIYIYIYIFDIYRTYI